MDQQSLALAYERCRRLHRRHGRTYYLATRLLPAWKRRHVHALYAFTRYADEIVDAPGPLTLSDRADRLAAWSAALSAPDRDDPLLPAVLHTVRVFDIDPADLRIFLDSMAMDLTVTGYATYDDLLRYMAGSAAAIGTMMLPILGTVDRAAAREPARELGLAFQLTNFIRDVAEDLGRGRVYLPAEDLAAFGVTPGDLAAASAARCGSARIRELIAYEVQRARVHYAAAAPGVALLDPSSRACIRAAFRIYGGILDEIQAQDHDVFRRRATVPNRRRLALALHSILAPGDAPPPLPGAPLDPARTPHAADRLSRIPAQRPSMLHGDQTTRA